MKQLELLKKHGGKRKGAGRPNKSGQPAHLKRAKINIKKPLHITMRLKKGAPDLRTKERLKEFKTAARKAKEHGLYIVHFSLLSNHIHMIVEATDNLHLQKGMKSFAGRLGKKLGGAFAHRFHMHVLKTPREMRNALAYVLLNEARHRKLLGYIDIFSSAKFFTHWRKLEPRNPLLEDPPEPLEDYLSPPQSWMASVGWMRAA